MSTTADFQITGVKELTKTLDQFGKKAKRSAVKEAVLAGSEVLKTAFENDAPTDTGHLRRNIGVRFRKYKYNSVGIVGGKSLKQLPVRDNTGIYFYILNFRKNVQKSHYLWANKSFDRVQSVARSAVISSLQKSTDRLARQVAS